MLEPTDREAMRPFRDLGALPPRPIKPRTLGEGVFRGLGDPQTLYRRIATGIAGTPMPSVQITGEPRGSGLTPEQAWDLVRYLQSFAGSAD
jgi:mono/diheme cytochrome c family protein